MSDEYNILNDEPHFVVPFPGPTPEEFSFKLGYKEAEEDLEGGWIPEEYHTPAAVRNHLEMAIGAEDSYIDGYIARLHEDNFFGWIKPRSSLDELI
jgi:hypothetical protein